MNIYCLGTLFTQLTLGLNAFITAQGKTLISMCNAAVGAVTNIILDAVFINSIGMGVFIISQQIKANYIYVSEIFALMDRLFGLVFCLVLHRH